jgi:hypothetical protein
MTAPYRIRLGITSVYLLPGRGGYLLIEPSTDLLICPPLGSTPASSPLQATLRVRCLGLPHPVMPL